MTNASQPELVNKEYLSYALHELYSAHKISLGFPERTSAGSRAVEVTLDKYNWITVHVDDSLYHELRNMVMLGKFSDGFVSSVTNHFLRELTDMLYPIINTKSFNSLVPKMDVFRTTALEAIKILKDSKTKVKYHDCLPPMNFDELVNEAAAGYMAFQKDDAQIKEDRHFAEQRDLALDAFDALKKELAEANQKANADLGRSLIAQAYLNNSNKRLHEANERITKLRAYIVTLSQMFKVNIQDTCDLADAADAALKI